MQPVASSHAVETTVSVVELKSDELKGRIIGREGRNIRALETLAGIDFIIDDTPGAVLLRASTACGARSPDHAREAAAGRAHPSSADRGGLHQAKSDIDQHIVQLGEQAVFEANVGQLDPELVRCSATAFPHEPWPDVLTTRSSARGWRACWPTSSARTRVWPPGGALARHREGGFARGRGPQRSWAGRWRGATGVRVGRAAMEAHHNEVELQTVEAVIVQIVDVLSVARPGARGESLEQYVKRLHELEAIATRHDGVDKVYAMHAGREIRVIVTGRAGRRRGNAAFAPDRPGRGEGARYPGQIKVTVIRESRATDYAR